MLMHVCIICGLLLSVLAILLLIRHLSSRKTVEETGPTWDCGYVAPTAEMQYTGASYSAPLEKFFHDILKKEPHLSKPRGLFPEKSVLSLNLQDISERCVWGPCFRGVEKLALLTHHIQSGYMHFYILLMTAAVVSMLFAAFLNPFNTPVSADGIQEGEQVLNTLTVLEEADGNEDTVKNASETVKEQEVTE